MDFCALARLAGHQEQYLRIAQDLANNPERLVQLRSNLRSAMAESAVCDAAGFTRQLEAAYRKMWRQWCNVAQQLNRSVETLHVPDVLRQAN